MPQTVLLVDDDADSRAICATILQHHGFAVIEADDGMAGLRMARDTLPDVVLMDVNLPGMDGWSATRELKGSNDTTQIPVIIFSARATMEDRDRGRGAGCDGYLVKPCSPTKIVAEVRRVLGITDTVEA